MRTIAYFCALTSLVAAACAVTSEEVIAFEDDTNYTDFELQFEVAAEPIMTCPETIAGLPEEYRERAGDSDRLIVVFKRLYKVALYEDGRLAQRDEQHACFDISMGYWPYEPKYERDYQSTPEGWYTVAVKRTADPKDEFPGTSYDHALHVSYPNATDVGRAEAHGVIDTAEAQRILAELARGGLPPQNTALGGQILIHTWRTPEPYSTAGCVGVEPNEAKWLFEQSQAGDPILLLPWIEVLLSDGSSQINRDIPPAPEIVYEIDVERTAREKAQVIFMKETIVYGDPALAER